MKRTDAPSKLRAASREVLDPTEIAPDLYEGLDLAANAQESLVTWDVSAHARREQDRLSCAARAAKEARGGY